MVISEEKIIELSKTKLLLLIVGSLAFIGIGAWMVSLDAAQIEAQRRYNDPLFIHGIGWVGIVFCVLWFVWSCWDQEVF